MSGWSNADQWQEDDMEFDFPAVNNITVAGYMPNDQVPSPGKFKLHLITTQKQFAAYGC